MRAVLLTAIAAGLAIGSLLMIGLVSRGNGNAPTTSADRVELLQPYESSFINLWVCGCISSGETGSFCRCAIDAYTTRLRPDEFETASAVAQGGGRLAELPEHLREVVKAVERDCR
jgi:hypothetical protein